MITETATTAIKSYLLTQGITIPIYTPRGVENMVYPCIQIEDSSSDEHEVLDGVYEVNIDVAYIATPNADADEGETEAELVSLSDTIYTALSCANMINILNIQPKLKVFDIGMQQLGSEEREGRSASLYNLEMVCCEV